MDMPSLDNILEYLHDMFMCISSKIYLLSTCTGLPRKHSL